MSSKEHNYTKRQVCVNPDKEMGVGNGQLRGYLMLALGLLNLLAALAFLMPDLLTTEELRSAYDGQLMHRLFEYSMTVSAGFGVVTLFTKKSWRKVLTGLVLTGVAFAINVLNKSSAISIAVPGASLAFGVDWLILSFISSVAIFTTLEKLMPRYQEQQILRRFWKLDLAYFTINHLLITAVIFIGNWGAKVCDFAISPTLQAYVQALPLWLQFMLVLLVADFILYWEHRLFHQIPALWKFHAVHHSVETMDWLAGSRSHIVSTFVERTVVIVPLYLIGPDKLALDLYVTMAALQAVYIHCNTKLSLGPLKKILVTAKYHHWHHSSEASALDTNFAAHTQLFDRLFGTLHNPHKHWPAVYGTTQPLPQSFFGQLWYPLKSIFPTKPHP